MVNPYVSPMIGDASLIQFNSAYQDIFYYLATVGYTQPWVNPATNGSVNVTASSWIDTRVPSEALDRQQGDDQSAANLPKLTTKPAPPSTYNQWHSSASGVNWIKFSFLNRAVSLRQYALDGRTSGSSMQSWQLHGSNDDVSWDLIHSVTTNPLNSSPYTYLSPVISSPYYKYLRFTNGLSGWCVLGEVYLFGLVTD